MQQPNVFYAFDWMNSSIIQIKELLKLNPLQFISLRWDQWFKTIKDIQILSFENQLSFRTVLYYEC